MRDPLVFKSPYEEGTLDREELVSFAAMCRTRAGRYTDSHVISNDMDGDQTSIETSELRKAFLEMEGVAHAMREQGHGLWLVT